MANTSEHGAELARRIDDARRRGFRPLMAVLERLVAEGERAGTGAPHREERIRFRHDPALVFSSSDVPEVRELELPADPDDVTARPRRAFEVTTAFLGLTGTSSPLPTYLPEEVAQEDPDQPRMRAFLDLFHHRALSLFHRARARTDYPATYLSDQNDPWSRRVLALLGFDFDTPRRTAAPSWKLLRYAPLLLGRALSAPALEAILTDALEADLRGAGVYVEQFAGAWVDIPASQRNRLGLAATCLGQDLLVGQRIFDRAGRCRVVIGPLTREGLERFAGEREPLRLLRETVATASADPLDFEIVLWLSPEAAPHLKVGALDGSRLGRNSWLGGQVREARLRVDMPA